MYAIGKVYIYCIKLYAQGVCIMVQFISRRKADFGKAALFVALYACINICLVSLLKEGLYLHGLKGILSGGVIFALAGHFWNYRKRFLAIYAGMMLFLSAGLIIKLIDHVAVGGGEFLGNISLASTIWGSILLVWLCIENAKDKGWPYHIQCVAFYQPGNSCSAELGSLGLFCIKSALPASGYRHDDLPDK